MNRHQQMHNSGANTEEIATRNIRSLGTKIADEKRTLLNTTEGKGTKKMPLITKVEVCRTVVTPSGRKFPPRPIKMLEIALELPAKSGAGTNSNYETLRERVSESFPRQQGQFSLFWKDSDAELVQCDNDDDLIKALDNVREGVLRLFIQGNWKYTNHGRIHDKEITCSNCHGNIQGERVKCLECPDFVMCPACDSQGIHDNHVMVKGDRPRFFHFALPMFADTLPKLCEEEKTKHSGEGPLPRLAPKDVRQFWQSQKKEEDGGNTKQGKRWHERRQEMREAWHKFLSDIASKESTDDNEVVPEKKKKCQAGENKQRERRIREKASKAETPDGGASSSDIGSDDREASDDENREKRQKLQQLKRQWMQKCSQDWRELLCKTGEPKEEESKQQGSRFQFRMWRPFMTQCWDNWQQQMADGNISAEQLPSCKRQGADDADDELRQIHPNPRRQWIQECWKLWRTEASRRTQQHSSEENGSDGQDEAAQVDRKNKCGHGRHGHHGHPSHGRHGHHGHPFVGYHFLMIRSWRFMLDKMKNEAKAAEADAVDNSDEETMDTSEEVANADGQSVGPQMAKQMLKRCWVNGARQLWWMQARKNLNMPEEEPKDEPKDIGESEPSQEEVLSAMKDHANWREYMQQTWVLWKQMTKQSGLSDVSDHGNKQAVEKEELVDTAQLNPKQRWTKACWQMWKEEMPQEGVPAKERPSHGSPKWNGRPFAGWRPLIMKSWKMMQEELGAERATPEKRQEQIQLMRETWMKEVRQEMKQLSLKSDENEDGKAEDNPRAGPKVARPKSPRRAGPRGEHPKSCPRAGPQDADQKPTPVNWTQRVELQKTLMTQYWQMWRNREEAMKEGAAGGGASCRRHWRKQKMQGNTGGRRTTMKKKEPNPV